MFAPASTNTTLLVELLMYEIVYLLLLLLLLLLFNIISAPRTLWERPAAEQGVHDMMRHQSDEYVQL